MSESPSPSWAWMTSGSQADDPVYFFDRNFGHRLPKALRLLGLRVEYHDEHFGPTTPDDAWLAEAGARGWTMIQHDRDAQRRGVEREAVLQHAVGCFIVGASSARSWDKARLLVRVWDRIDDIARTQPRPFVFRILGNGEVRQIYPPP